MADKNTAENKNILIDKEMKDVLEKIKSIDSNIKGLNKRRSELVDKYEKLNEEKFMYEAEASAVEHNWESETFPWSEKVRDTLHDVFKMKKFRPQQLQTINCVLAKKDVLMIAPTGGGKSLCYQLPAIISEGLTIVVSPLISLMEDQVWSLKKLGIEAVLLSATVDKSMNNLVLKQMMEKTNSYPFKLLYVTPERLAKSKRFMSALQKCYLAKRLHMIAIDEVHCCSQWGHDFRPDYKFLGTLKTLFPDVAILGVTATATTKVILDVQKMLNIRQAIVLKAPFNRPNLFYHVIEKPSDKDQCVELLYDLLKNRYANKSGIIYAFSIADTEELSSALVSKGLLVRPYHANLTADRRTKIHTKWLTGEIQAVVATVAFGMGIDKPNVRFVIHHTLSKSMENFYQESGRAGRDGNRAECILLYRFQDMSRITTMMFTEHTGLKNAYEMIEFAIDGISCRRDLIGKHFTEVWSDAVECNKMCDRCYYKDSVYPPKMIITDYCLELYKIIDRAVSIDVKLTGLKLVDAWYQKGATNLRVKEIAPPKLERYFAEQIVAFLIVKGYLKEDFHISTYTTYSYIRKGSRITKPDDRIVFYASRILHLPANGSELWRNGNVKEEEDCIIVVDDAKRKKKKSKKERASSHSRDDSVCNDSLDDSFVSASNIKRRRTSSDAISVPSSTVDEVETPKTEKKKSKIKSERKSEENKRDKRRENDQKSPENDDDCLVVWPQDVVIEIED